MAEKYECTECGYQNTGFLGSCPNCDASGPLEKIEETEPPSSNSSGSGTSLDPTPLQEYDDKQQQRHQTGISELDRVLGGGVVPGSAILLGGPPGIGKSTLLLQWAGQWEADGPVLYVHGEESGTQIARRARRLGIDMEGIELETPDVIEQVTEQMGGLDPSLLFVDSIQTVISEESDGMAGGQAQMRAVTSALTTAAKHYNVPMVMVGHVTKSGQIGGPKRVEHMVDAVLYFNDVEESGHRFLRATKNRFGETNELGLFTMTGQGLRSIDNPGEHFGGADESEAGCALTVSLEGVRPILVEVQALVSDSHYETPQRSTAGFPKKRLRMLIAVIEKQLEIYLGDQDIFINVAGGLNLTDPGVDLAVLAAMVSSFGDMPLPSSLALVGEVGLTGRLRPPAQPMMRCDEARRLQKTPILVGGNPTEVENADDIIKEKSLTKALKTMRQLIN